MSSLKRTKSEEVPNLCVSCGMDLGSENPRQYCRKTWCPVEFNSVLGQDLDPDLLPDVPDVDSRPNKRRRLEKKLDEKAEKVKKLYLDVDQIEKDILALKKALEEEN